MHASSLHTPRVRSVSPTWGSDMGFRYGVQTLLQVGRDNSDSATTRTLFGRQNRARRLQCVSKIRIPLYLGHFCFSRPVRVVEAYLYKRIFFGRLVPADGVISEVSRGLAKHSVYASSWFFVPPVGDVECEWSKSGVRVVWYATHPVSVWASIRAHSVGLQRVKCKIGFFNTERTCVCWLQFVHILSDFSGPRQYESSNTERITACQLEFAHVSLKIPPLSPPEPPDAHMLRQQARSQAPYRQYKQ